MHGDEKRSKEEGVECENQTRRRDTVAEGREAKKKKRKNDDDRKTMVAKGHGAVVLGG